MRLLLALVVACMTFSCADEPGPPLVADNVSITRPLPGMQTSAAYLELTNRSRDVIDITNVTSPEFVSVEMQSSARAPWSCPNETACNSVHRTGN